MIKRIALITVMFIAAIGAMCYTDREVITAVQQREAIEQAEKPGNTEKMENKADVAQKRSISRGETSSSAADINKKDYSALVEQIKNYIKDKDGNYGVYFISLTGHQKFGINESNQFVAASTVKVPVNLYLYTRIASGEVKADTKVTYTKEDYEEGTGIIQDEEFGKQYTLKELSRLSIEESDNVAVNMIIRTLGKENIHQFMAEVQQHPIDTEHNLATPKEMAVYLKALRNFCKKNPVPGEELLGYLENTKFNNRIPFYLPKDIKVAHKIGTQVNTVNDIGIVFAEKPYVLCIMSKDVTEAEAEEAIAKISKMVYDFEEK